MLCGEVLADFETFTFPIRLQSMYLFMLGWINGFLLYSTDYHLLVSFVWCFIFSLLLLLGAPLRWHFLSFNMSVWGGLSHPTWELAPSLGFPPAPPLGCPPSPAHTLAPSSGLLQFHPNPLSVAETSFLPWLFDWIVQEGNRRMRFCSRSCPSVPLQIFTNSFKNVFGATV